MKIVLAGPKGSGKSSIGARLSQETGLPLSETDDVIERIYEEDTGKEASCREICAEKGESAFRELERRAVERVAADDWHLVSTGGSTLLDPDSRRLLRREAILVLLCAEPEALEQRVRRGGVPSYLTGDDPFAEFRERVARIQEVLRPYADVTVRTDLQDADQSARIALEGIREEISLRRESFSSAGLLVRLTTFGESHGPAVGAVLDGIRPGVEISEEDIQVELDRRRPGQSRMTTSRNEPDRVQILSGVFEGRTTGHPIAMLVQNKDSDSSKYDALKDLFRPGHADFTFWKKYGLRDHRGGGRASGRETASRVAGGAVARKILAERGLEIVAHTVQIGDVLAATFDEDAIERNPVRCADPDAAAGMQELVLQARKEGNSIGGAVELVVRGCPAGLGDPIFGKLDARLAHALFSLGAVKGVEIGVGFRAAQMRGSEFNDPMRDGQFVTNNAGGILGGISTGADIIAKVAVKPTPSISQQQQTIDKQGRNVDVTIEGRHDPCIVPRIVPVVEAMAALVLLDSWELQRRLRPEATG
jgi:chorismate synthase